MSELVEYAAAYINAGLHVIALTGKRPNGAFHAEWDYEDSIHGTIETPEDFADLYAIFGHETTTGVAILIPPHVLVADVDTEEAATLFMALAGTMPETPVARTRAGLHVWLIAEGADQSRWLGGRTLLFKGLGGYVVAPPSVHPDGGVYTWITPLVVDGRITGMDYLPAQMKEWLDAVESVETRKDVPYRPPFIPRLIITPTGIRSELVEMDPIDGLCHAIIEATDGNQNSTIMWATATAQEEGIPFDVAYPRLMEAALAGNHPRKRAHDTITGVYKRRSR